MNNSFFKKNFGLLLLSSLVAAPFASAKDIIVGCNGAANFTLITKLSQLTQSGENEYRYVARPGESVVMDFEPGNSTASIFVYFTQTGANPGTNSLCSNGDFSLRVKEGNYVNAYGAKDLTVEATDPRGITIFTDAVANITTGDGNDIIQIDAPTIRPQVVTSSASIIQTGKGNDTIKIKNNYLNFAVHAGDGDDLVTLSTTPNANNIIVGGKGTDNITSGEGSDLVYGSDISYNNLAIENIPVTNFQSAFALLSNNVPVRKIQAGLSPNLMGDVSGGSISTNGGDDIIHGTNGADYIKVGAGNDQVHGWGGADQINGQDGNDEIWGGDQTDSISGENGKDTIYGEAGDDKLSGGADGDKVFGGTGMDLIYGDAGDDWLYGDADNDTLIDTQGSNQLNGGAGTDTCTVIGLNNNTSCER